MLLNVIHSSITRQIRSITSGASRYSAVLSQKGNLGVVGLPFNKGQPKGGVEGGPSLIRQQGLIADLQSIGWHVKDYGDQEFDSVDHDAVGLGIKNPRNVGLAMGQISSTVKGIVEGDGLCVNLGGDHSIALGTIHGHCRVHPDACVIWVDAHADLNTPRTTPSANFHGMPLSFVLRELEDDVAQVKELDEWKWLGNGCISAKDIVYLGLRDVDPGERHLLRSLGIKAFSMYEIDKYGIAECVSRAVKAVNPNKDRPIHLSYDVDSLDPAYALSTGTPVMGGLTVREGFFVAEEIAATNLLTVMDMVEVNPALADSVNSNMTASTAARIITSCFGSRIL